MTHIFIDRRRVVALMKAAKIPSYAELARATGLHKNTLARALSQSGWHSGTLEALARALSCNPLDLVVTIGFPAPSFGDPGMALPGPNENLMTPPTGLEIGEDSDVLPL